MAGPQCRLAATLTADQAIVRKYSKSAGKKRKPMWAERLDWAYSQPLVSVSRTSVLAYLVRRADKNGICWPTIELISSDTKAGEKTVRTSIKVIEACGLITVTRTKTPGKRKGRTGIKNRYQLQYTHTATAAEVNAAESAASNSPKTGHCPPRPNGNCDRLIPDDQTVTENGPSGNSYRVSIPVEEATRRGG